MTLEQGSTSIEEHARRFTQLYEQLLAMGDNTINQRTAAQAFVMSLNGEVFGTEVTRWARAGEIPDNLGATTRLCIEWFRQIQNATKAMGHGPPRRGRGEEHREETGFTAGVKRAAGDHHSKPHTGAQATCQLPHLSS